MYRIALIALMAAGCSGPAARFERPQGIEVYPATDNVSEVELLTTAPTREFVLVGTVESQSGNLTDALPGLLRSARNQGGNAIIGLRFVQAGRDGPIVIRADVIRWVLPR